MKVYLNYINGRWTRSNSKKTFTNIDPATEKPLGKFQASNKHDVEHAVKAAEKSLPIWKETPAPERAEYLFKITRILKRHKERLARIETKEMGKVLKETKGDVQEAIDIFEFMAGEGRRLYGITTPSELKNKFNATVRIPLGIVGLITPWNFPMAIPSWKLAPALICGNTIIFKPSSDTPQSAYELIKIIEKAKVPKGIVNMITGSGREVGAPIIKHPKVNAISFTGSRDTGKFITRNAGLKKVGLELGGKNPTIIMDDADLKLALNGVIWGAFGTTGQRCTATSRVIIHKKVRKKFESLLIKETRKLKLGSGLKRKTDVGPLINFGALEKVSKYVNLGEKEGGKVLCGAKEASKRGFFYEPTIFTKVKPHMTIAQEEIFGPVLAIIEAKDLREAIKIANQVDYGLSSSIYTNNVSNALKAIEKLETGIVYVNSPTIGAEVHLPFGGTKDTGNGTREGGTIEEFSEIKTIYVDYSGSLQKAQGIE